MKDKSETLQLRVSPQLKQKLKEASLATGVSMSKLIEQSLENFLSNISHNNLSEELEYLKKQVDNIYKTVTS